MESDVADIAPLDGGPRMLRAKAARQMARVRERPGRRERSPRPARTPERVIVVLGYHKIGDDGRHGISSICRAAVRRAEALAAEAPPRAVIFTGWSSTGGPAEADQMAAEWQGRGDIAPLREPRAGNTAA